MTPLNTISSRLTQLLRRHERGKVEKRPMVFPALPLTTTLAFEGTPLARIMSPAVPSDPFECEQLFDTFMSVVKEGEGDALQDLGEAGGRALREFVKSHVRSDATPEQEMATRLLFALGRSEGARLVWNPRSIEVFHGDRTFGITDGVVESRFCSGFQVGAFDPDQILTMERRITSYDRDFCNLYREANRLGDDVRNALVALLMGNPTFSFKAMAKAGAHIKFPTAAKLAQWERILFSRKDPIGALYIVLVPVWMTAPQFAKIFGRMAGRSLEPTSEQIQGCITRLHTHFYKPKKKE